MTTEKPTEKLEAIDTTMKEAPEGPGKAPGLLLRVLNGPSVTTVSLPARGVVLLGRSGQVDVPIDAASVSRQHARIHVGRTLQIEDLGSANGTFVRGVQLTQGHRVDVLPGDEILLGKVLCIVQGAARSLPPYRHRTLHTHDYFVARLDDECARASSTSDAFGLLRLRVEGAAGAGFESSLLSLVRPSEVVAWYGPGDYELLLPDAPSVPDRSAEFARALKRAEWEVRAGAALYPRDGRTQDALLERASAALQSARSAEATQPLGDIVVEDAAMQKLHRHLTRIAASDISVLLLGETGTGKEVFAERIHALSPRKQGPFVVVNCGAIPESLIEGELFGHVKGAYTGAITTRPGKFQAAHGGTLFLDEIGELPIDLQPKLLRALQERVVTKVGDSRSEEVDIRVIAATNRDLEQEIAEKRFRPDLFFRINGFSFEIPPLRDRVTEVEPLARRFLALFTRHYRRPRAPELSSDALTLLREYSWPGNIRELKNMMERALILAEDDVITAEHLPIERMVSPSPGRASSVPDAPAALRASSVELTINDVRPLEAVKDEVERDYVRRVLSLCNGNQTRAAELLDISRGTLVKAIEKYGLPRPRGGR